MCGDDKDQITWDNHDQSYKVQIEPKSLNNRRITEWFGVKRTLKLF